MDATSVGEDTISGTYLVFSFPIPVELDLTDEAGTRQSYQACIPHCHASQAQHRIQVISAHGHWRCFLDTARHTSDHFSEQ